MTKKPSPESEKITGKNAAPDSEGFEKKAESHYFKGNRFFENKAWDLAAQEWKRATSIWHPTRAVPRSKKRFFVQLRVALAIIFTFILIQQSLFFLFPRDPMEMMMLSASQPQESSWWERFIDNGRPRSGDDHKMTFREWWNRFRNRLSGDEGERLAKGSRLRPDIAKRWESLLRRYGRWGDFYTWDMDYSVISGHGLSRLGDYDSAVEVLEKALKDEKKPVKLADLYQGLANAHYYKGYHLQPDGLARYDLPQVSQAAKAYEKSIDNQRRPLSYGNLGWMYFLLGDFQQAEKHSQRALEINQNLHYVRLNLGLIYLFQNRLRDSFDSYYAVIRQNPADEVYLGGINDLKEVLRDNAGSYPFAYLIVGVLSLKKRELSDARQYLTRFLSGPTIARSWKNLANQLLEDMDTSKLEN